MGPDGLSRNVGKELPLYAALISLKNTVRVHHFAVFHILWTWPRKSLIYDVYYYFKCIIFYYVLNILVNILAVDGGWSPEYVGLNKKLYWYLFSMWKCWFCKWEIRSGPVAYTGILFGGGQQIHLRTEDRENGDMGGAVAPYSGVLEAAVIWYQKFLPI